MLPGKVESRAGALPAPAAVQIQERLLSLNVACQVFWPGCTVATWIAEPETTRLCEPVSKTLTFNIENKEAR